MSKKDTFPTPDAPASAESLPAGDELDAPVITPAPTTVADATALLLSLIQASPNPLRAGLDALIGVWNAAVALPGGPLVLHRLYGPSHFPEAGVKTWFHSGTWHNHAASPVLDKAELEEILADLAASATGWKTVGEA